MRRITMMAGLFLLLSTTTLLTSGKAQEGKPSDKAPPPAQTPPHLVSGLQLPPPKDYDPDEDYVIIDAKTDPDWKLEQVEWVVMNLGNKAVKYNELGSSLITGLPAKGETLYIYANALVTKEVDDPANKGQKIKQFKMTKHAVTTVTVKEKADGGGTPQPGQAVPTKIPAGIRQISVIVVYPQGSPPVVKNLASSKALSDALAKGESKFFPYEATPANAQLLTTKGLWKYFQEAGVPGVLIVTNDKRVLPNGKAIPLPLGSDPAKNEFILLDIVGRATGGSPGSK